MAPVLSLLEAIGTVNQKLDGKVELTHGPEKEVWRPPRGKDVDVQMVVDLRRMLEQAGFAPDAGPAIPDQRSRDHGDGQWANRPSGRPRSPRSARGVHQMTRMV